MMMMMPNLGSLKDFISLSLLDEVNEVVPICIYIYMVFFFKYSVQIIQNGLHGFY